MSDIALVIGFAASVATFSLRRLNGTSPRLIDAQLGAVGTDAARPVLFYWLAAYLMLLVSTLGNWHTVSSFGNPALQLAGFTASFLITVAVYLEARDGKLLPIMRWFNAASLLILAVYLGGYATKSSLFMFGARFKGLSENPNQTALHMLCIIVVAVMTLVKADRTSLVMRTIASVNIVLAFFLGVVSQSDAFTLAVAITLLVGMSHFLYLRARASMTGFGIIVTVLVPLLLAALLLKAGSFPHIERAISSQLEQGNQDSDRILLWRNGLRAWWYDPIFGHGVGAWSGFRGPLEGEEAHNSFIDWLTMTGLVGLAFLLGLLTRILKRQATEYLTSYYALLSIVAFSFFHLTLRHPMLWFSIVCIFMVNTKRLALDWPGAPDWSKRQATVTQVLQKA